jgi:hypothetical protein
MNVEELAWLRDEVNEPLGLLPGPDPRAGATMGWTILSIAAPVLVAVAMAAFTFGRQDAQPRGQSFTARTEAAPTAPVRAEPPPSPASASADNAALPPVATADQVEAASGVKVTRQGGATAPAPLIIDVQQALAAANAKAAKVVPR